MKWFHDDFFYPNCQSFQINLCRLTVKFCFFMRRGHIVFGANPVGVGVGMTLSCLHDISWTSGWILTKFAWMYQWDMMKSWLGFGDFDLIFKVTVELPNLSQKVLVCTISHELVGSFQPDLHGYNIGTWWRPGLVLVTMTYFSRSLWDLNCQIWANRCLCAQYLMNQLADFNQICMVITFGHDKKLKRFWWPWSNFQGHCQT